MTQPIQPIFILPEDTKRSAGRDAQRNNIAAAKAVADAVRTTLGPKGMDKMIVDASGDVTVTNDGVTILREMNVEHPAARMVVEVAKTQEQVVGDGTTTVAVIAGELLRKAEELLDQNIHPTIIAKGYRAAEGFAQTLLRSHAKPVTLQHHDVLHSIVCTAMTGKGAEAHRDHLANLLLEAVNHVASSAVDNTDIIESIKIEKMTGESPLASSLVRGVVLDKERAHSSMPRRVDIARVALLDCPLEIKNTEIDAKIQINDPTQLHAFLDREEHLLREMVNVIAQSGANVVLCQRGVDDLVQHFFAKRGILAVRRVTKSDMERLARATGGHIVSSWKELSPADLGSAGCVRQEKIANEEILFVEECPDPKTVTLLVRGGTSHVADEIKRAVEDALGDLSAALRDGFVIAGAGSMEMELSCSLRGFARTLQGREQLAVEAYAQALEVIPRTLAENAGLDPIDVLAALRAAHEQGMIWAGVNIFTGEVMDAWAAGVLEPLKVKTQALSSATQVAEMILRIDDVIMNAQAAKMTRRGPSSEMDGM
ncbi:TCP-1/cpn60 chaperonin family protein [Candidatus Woesearchaeota archaeon]|nr:TCP-1/cpn60 chaperonin family protein [Candidatus Woesearchaeota archaeon]